MSKNDKAKLFVLLGKNVVVKQFFFGLSAPPLTVALFVIILWLLTVFLVEVKFRVWIIGGFFGGKIFGGFVLGSGGCICASTAVVVPDTARSVASGRIASGAIGVRYWGLGLFHWLNKGGAAAATGVRKCGLGAIPAN